MMNANLYRLTSRRFVILITTVAALMVFPVSYASAEGSSQPVEDRPVRTIVIDPGHGGSDSGVIGPEGTTEKSVTLALARLIVSQLEGRYRVLLTRTGDYQVGGTDRIAIANHNRSDLFLSLHVGGGFSMQCNTASVYFLSSEDASENVSDINPETYSVSDFPVGPPVVIWDEAHFDHQRLSKAFADILCRSCRRVLGKCSQIKGERIAVLEGADMPAAMIEIGCLENPNWEKQFRESDRMVAISSLISEAIVRFFQSE